jgi:hypothetical protein
MSVQAWSIICPPALEHLGRRDLEQLFFAGEVVVERPESDVGLVGDPLNARALAAALGGGTGLRASSVTRP